MKCETIKFNNDDKNQIVGKRQVDIPDTLTLDFLVSILHNHEDRLIRFEKGLSIQVDNQYSLPDTAKIGIILPKILKIHEERITAMLADLVVYILL